MPGRIYRLLGRAPASFPGHPGERQKKAADSAETLVATLAKASDDAAAAEAGSAEVEMKGGAAQG
ncbi:hypothetical protein OHA37_37230 [Streptomyces sp. NBC_00335]|uniref:hypothetical protein n=1 Tax=unclassified Streptomyces TaxID=2593676 RepID=UPI002254D476|nr:MULTISPECIES: hypothetical protein [unclassified Streptomyces]MCX5409487.1 hypothetical protein [Streptomyces sp. NBC_00086]